MPDLVIKIGGGMLVSLDDLDLAVRGVAVLARSCRVLVVPGGGPFADTVREVDRRLRLPDAAAHWMAVLAMDQYAYLLASRLDAATVVWSLAEASTAWEAAQVPVLAPFRWLREQDPLPHTWDVTSDSIAAWIAGVSRARELLVVKPRGATGTVLDGHFARALPQDVRATVATADQADAVFAEIEDRLGASRASAER